MLITLKVCVLGADTSQEVALSHHFRSIDHGQHPGIAHLRVALDEFQVQSPSGIHQCLVFPALGMNLTQLRDLFEDRAIDKNLLQRFLLVILTALDLMHQAGVVHTGPIINLDPS